MAFDMFQRKNLMWLMHFLVIVSENLALLIIRLECSVTDTATVNERSIIIQFHCWAKCEIIPSKITDVTPVFFHPLRENPSQSSLLDLSVID